MKRPLGLKQILRMRKVADAKAEEKARILECQLEREPTLAYRHHVKGVVARLRKRKKNRYGRKWDLFGEYEASQQRSATRSMSPDERQEHDANQVAKVREGNVKDRQEYKALRDRVSDRTEILEFGASVSLLPRKTKSAAKWILKLPNQTTRPFASRDQAIEAWFKSWRDYFQRRQALKAATQEPSVLVSHT